MRGAGAGLVAAVLVLAMTVPGVAAKPLGAQLVCEPARAPGRVVCAVELSAPPEQRIAWADALVLSAPSFARPLRSRVTVRDDQAAHVRLPLALVLEEPGRGLLRVRARAVLCSRGPREHCGPSTRDTELELVAVR